VTGPRLDPVLDPLTQYLQRTVPRPQPRQDPDAYLRALRAMLEQAPELQRQTAERLRQTMQGQEARPVRPRAVAPADATAPSAGPQVTLGRTLADGLQAMRAPLAKMLPANMDELRDVGRVGAGAALDVGGMFVEGLQAMAQPFQPPAPAEGGFRNPLTIYQDENDQRVQATRDKRAAIREELGPTTRYGQLAQIPAALAANAAPFVAAGFGAAPMLTSAGLTGVASQAEGGSFSGALGVEDPAARAALDIGTDLTLGMAGPALGVLRRGQSVPEALGRLAGSELASVGQVPFGLRIRDVSKQTMSPRGAGRDLTGQTVIPVEATPGSLWNVETAQGIAQTYPRTRALYGAEQLETTNPLLAEMDKHFGLTGGASAAENPLFGLGSYDGQANVNLQVVLPGTVSPVYPQPVIDEATGQVKLNRAGSPVTTARADNPRAPSALEKDATALALAIGQRQNAVPWMTPTPVNAKEAMRLTSLPADRAAELAAQAGLPETGVVVIPVPKAMNPGQAEHVAGVLQAAGLPHSFTQVGGAEGAYLLFGNYTRFSDTPVSDATLLKQVASALNGDEVWEKVAPGDVQPFFARAFGNYLGDADEASHLAQLRQIAEQTDDPAAAALAGRFADFLDRNRDRLRAGQEQVDRAFQPAVAFDAGIADELRAGGVAPAPGLEAPYSARGLHPSLLERGDPAVPLLTPAGKIPDASVPATTSPANVERSLQAIDQAFAATPNPMADEAAYKRWASQLFGPVVPRRPSLPAEMTSGTSVMPSLLTRLDDTRTLGPARMRSQMGAESDAGLQIGQQFADAYKTGTADPVTSLMLYSWGSLSKRASVAPHETAFIDLLFAENGDTLAPILDRVARGVYGDADEARIKQIAATLPEGAFSKQVTSNINALSQALKKMAQPARNAAMVSDGAGGLRPETNAERWHALLADRSATDEEFLRGFQRSFAGEGIGMDNKVVSFIGLVTGRRDLIVPDRVQLALQYNAPRDFANSSLASNIYEKAGLSNLFTGAQGIAMQEGIQRAIRPTLEPLGQALNRPGQLDLGGLHWESWVASSDQEVGHGSLDVIARQARGEDVTKATSLVKEGQLDKFRYGEFQGVLNGQRVFGFVTSDGRYFAVPRKRYLEIIAQNKKMAPKGFSISKNTTAPYWEVPGYPRDARDQLIMQSGVEVPPPSAEAAAEGAPQRGVQPLGRRP